MRAGITRARVITVVAIVLFVGGTVAAVAGWGLDISRDVSFIWAMIGLLALSLTDLRRWAKGLFVGQVPSAWLQEHLYNPFTAHWYDYGVFAVYMTHFFATLVIAALLW